MILRRAQVTDVAALTACIKSAYAPFMDLGLPDVASGVADDIRDHIVWVAEIEGEVRGGIVFSLEKTAHIINLAVHPAAGGHGVGKALISAALDAARAANYTQVNLATHVDMTGTQAFYRKTGWQETGREGNKVYFVKELN